MGHQQDVATPCGTPGCAGRKVTLYVYDDEGNCIAQHMMPCDGCGQ